MMKTVSGNIVDALKKKIFPGTIFIEGDKIVRIQKDKNTYSNFILPGFVDAHVHIESSMLTPFEFGRAVLRHGTLGVVSDPHEIANVMGVKGVNFMIDNALKSPLEFLFGAPSSVPATPFETAGGEITAKDIEELFRTGRCGFLSEMMNVPGVLSEDREVLEKINTAKKYSKKIDGHAPEVTGDLITKYIKSGIDTDHEAVSYSEGREKILKGMKILIREGSAARNFDELFPLIDEFPAMCMFCTDDIHPDNLLKGHINLHVKKAVKRGCNIYNVLKAASVNPVMHYGLRVGLLQEGDFADFILVDNLVNFGVLECYAKGEHIYKKGFSDSDHKVDTELINNFRCSLKTAEDFRIKSVSGSIKVIDVTDGQLITGTFNATLPEEDGFIVQGTGKDILKISVVNRYKDSEPAVGFVRGFGLKRGAIGGSVAHDSHNIIVAGCDDNSITSAVNAIIKAKGGLVFADGLDVQILELPVAGLISDKKAEDVAERYILLDKIARGMGSTLLAPFMTLSFMALLVIPELKISDKGLFDGKKFTLVPLSN